MKKSLLFAGLAAATLSIVGCNRETDFRDLDGRPVEIVLNTPDTRTVNDGMSTKWVKDDQLSVFYAPAGTTTYSQNKKFTITDAENNVASGTVSLEADANDWYLLYAYASQITTPANTSGGYSYIGCRSDASQVQDGYDSMAHLAGCAAAAGFPLFGIAKNVPKGDTPEVTMKHVASALAVKVKNDTEAPITITKVEFTAPENIVGSFYVNFTQDPVVLTPHATFVSKTASATVQNATALAPNATATIYMGIKPFTAASGSELSLKITANEGSVEKKVTLGSAVDFTAGSIKTLNVGYSNATVLPAITIGDIKSSLTSSTSSVDFEGTLSNAIVTFVSADKKYAFIQDAADGIVLYRNTGDITLKAGDALSGAISGAGTVYKNLKEITSLTVENVVSDQAIPAPLELSLAELNADYDKYVSYRVKVKGVTVETAFSSRSTTMKDGEESLALRDQKNGLTITAGKYDIVGYASYFTSAQFGVWNQDDIIEVHTDEKLFGVSQDEFTVGPDVTSVQFTVTGNVDWTVVAGEGITSVDPEEGSGEATVTVTFPANTSAEEKEYGLLVGTEETNVENSEYEITITQGACSVKSYPYEESFAEGQGDFSINNVDLGGLTYVWSHATHNDDKYMKATGYVNGNKATESWLISPVVDLSGATNPALTFKHAISYFTSVEKAQEEATVWARVKGGSWAQLEGITYPTTQNFTFVESGPVSLSAYVGQQVQIGFKYVSTTTKAGTWEVMNFKLAEAAAVNPTLEVPASLTVEAGQSAKINVNTNSDGDVSYESASTAIATVAADGTVTGVAVGSTTVTVSVAATASFNAASKEVTVNVEAPGIHKIVASDFFSANSNDINFLTGEYSVSTTKGTGSNGPSYVANDKDIRLYKGNTITIKNRTAHVTKIIFNLSAQGKKRLAPITASVGTVTAQQVGDTQVEWTGDASEVTFTVGDKADYGSDGSSQAGQLDFTSISVDPWTGVTPSKALVSIAIAGQKTFYTVNDALDKGTVTATFDDLSTDDVTSDAVFSGYDLTVAGDYTVKVQYTYGGVTKETTYGISVVTPSSWTRVKTVAELLAGGTFVIGYEETANTGVIVPMQNSGSATTSAAGFMYSGTTSGSTGKTTVNMATLTAADAAPYIVTVSESSLVEGAVNIKVGSSYLGNEDTKNNCKLYASPSKNTAFTPSVGENDVFTLTIAENATYTTLQYNSSSPRFAVYGGGQKNVVIYKL